MKPYDKLTSATDAALYLKPAVTLDHPDALTFGISDNESARRMTAARARLFKSISDRSAAAA
jgi:hypothetical protein